MGRLKSAVGKSRKKKKAVDPGNDETPSPPRRSRARRAQNPASKKSAKALASKEEPDAIRKARERIRAFVREVTKDAPKASIGIVLALVNQETGSHKAANALIDELDLEKSFGIRKF